MFYEAFDTKNAKSGRILINEKPQFEPRYRLPDDTT